VPAKPGHASSKAARDRLKAVPWALLLQSGLVVGRRVRALSAKDRQRLARLLRESRGWPGSLSERDRSELTKLVGKLDVGAIGREVLPLVRGPRKSRLKGTPSRARAGKRR
jgi:hypothetical protein